MDDLIREGKIIHAICSNDIDAVRQLVQQKDTLNNVLQYALLYNRVEIAQYLISIGYDINFRNYHDFQSLYYYEQARMLKHLVVPNISKTTANYIHSYAQANNDRELINLLNQTRFNLFEYI